MNKAVVLVLLFGILVTCSARATDPIRPDHELTPGVTLAVTARQVCVRGYAHKVRNVPESEKRAVYREYGIKPVPRAYEIDHLISLELGGANAEGNLWPQSYLTKPLNAHVKDRLEDRLHTLVCHGKVSLKDAQQAIRTDWVAAYRKYVGPLP